MRRGREGNRIGTVCVPKNNMALPSSDNVIVLSDERRNYYTWKWRYTKSSEYKIIAFSGGGVFSSNVTDFFVKLVTRLTLLREIRGCI